MESKFNYTLVGFFIVVLLAAIIVISFWLTVGLERQPYKTYLTYMNESVAGLSQQAAVKYNGVDVGYVSNIELNLNNPQQVILTLKIKPNVPVTESTEAVLMEQGITGIAYVGLRGGDNASPLKPGKGQKYPVIKSAPSFLFRLDKAINSLTTNIESLSIGFKQLLSKENIKNLSDTIQQIDVVTETFAKNSTNIDKSLQSLQVLLKNGAGASKQLPQVLDEIRQSANSLKVMTKDFGKAADQGTITLQTFNNQILPKAYNTLQSINAVSDNLKSFTQDLKENPAIIIRGKTAATPGPGEQ